MIPWDYYNNKFFLPEEDMLEVNQLLYHMTHDLGNT